MTLKLTTTVLLLGGSSGCAPSCELAGTFGLEAQAEGGARIEGTVFIAGPTSRTNLLYVSPEGRRETINVPLEVLFLDPDSVQFTFAPAGFQFDGSCVGSGSWEGRFSLPQPPFDDLRGTWTMRPDQAPSSNASGFPEA